MVRSASCSARNAGLAWRRAQMAASCGGENRSPVSPGPGSVPDQPHVLHHSKRATTTRRPPHMNSVDLVTPPGWHAGLVPTLQVYAELPWDARRPWRPGSKPYLGVSDNHRTIYLQLGELPSLTDPMLGCMDTPGLALLACYAVNLLHGHEAGQASAERSDPPGSRNDPLGGSSSSM